jgi:hypothetical protein
MGGFMNIKAIITGVTLIMFFILGGIFLDYDNLNQSEGKHDAAVIDASNAHHSNKKETDLNTISNPFGDNSSNNIDPSLDEVALKAEIINDQSVAINPEEQETSTPNKDDGDESLEDLIARQEAYYKENVEYAGINYGKLDFNNPDIPPGEEFKEQIDQQMIIEQARAEGYEVGNTQASTTEPSKENSEVSPKGEYYNEIDQELILETAQIGGIEITGVDANTPKDDNISIAPDGAYADQIEMSQPVD